MQQPPQVARRAQGRRHEETVDLRDVATGKEAFTALGELVS